MVSVFTDFGYIRYCRLKTTLAGGLRDSLPREPISQKSATKSHFLIVDAIRLCCERFATVRVALDIKQGCTEGGARSSPNNATVVHVTCASTKGNPSRAAPCSKALLRFWLLNLWIHTRIKLEMFDATHNVSIKWMYAHAHAKQS